MQSPDQPPRPQFAVIIPACDEEACLGRVLDEIARTLDPEKFVVAVGVNGSSDGTAAVARAHGVLVTETSERGYGYGCQKAIDLVASAFPSVRAYIFFAGDGASDPQDVRKLVAAYEQGYAFVLGARTGQWSNWGRMRFSHVVANFALALWCGVLTSRWFKDLAPLRCRRRIFAAIARGKNLAGIEGRWPQRYWARDCEVARATTTSGEARSGMTGSDFAVGCHIFAAACGRGCVFS